MGDKEIIDNPPALPAPKKQIPQEPPELTGAEGMYGAARRKDPVP